MFDIRVQDHEFTVWRKEQPLFSCTSIKVKDASGKEYLLQIQGIEEQAGDCWRLRVEDGSGLRKGWLIAEQYDNSLRLRCEIAQPLDVLKRVEAFAPRSAVSLKIEAVDLTAGFMANYSYYQWWTRPAFGTDAGEIPDKTRSLLWRTTNEYVHLLTMASGDFISELKGGEEGIILGLSSEKAGCRQADGIFFTVSCGTDPYLLPVSNAGFGANCWTEAAMPIRQDKQYPPVLEKLGWCTWDAFYHEVTDDKVYLKAAEFIENKLPVSWIIVDDGWSIEKDKMLASLDADKAKFPNGMSAFITHLKQQYNINHVGLWHAFTGYWHGIHPELAEKPEMKGLVSLQTDGRYLPSLRTQEESFYTRWHSQLKKEGVDFVKVDSQGSIALFQESSTSLNESARTLHLALDQSVQQHFDGTVINCMGMEQENIWNRSSSVSRNSDDFYPNKPGSTREHILQNAFNSYYHSAFYWGDWDMFWTKHPEAKQHAFLRAVSGGPIYFSDPVGQTDPAVLWPLILQDGSILRCEQPGLPSRDCLLTDYTKETVPLKIYNRCKIGGVIAAFHVTETAEAVQGMIRVQDIEGLSGDEFAVFDYDRQTVSRMSRTDKMPIRLGAGEASIYSLIPFRRGLAPIGLINKYVPPASIAGMEERDDEIDIHLKEGGLFAFAADPSPKEVRIQDILVSVIEEREGYGLIDCSEFRQPVTLTFRFSR